MLRFIGFIFFCSFFVPKPSQATDDDRLYEQQRKNMVTCQIEARGIKDKRVLQALLKVKRHLFVPADIKSHAYEDSALPIDKNQTISQPYIVALMTELAQIKPDDKVLEIGTGSGYQTAILAELTKNVFSMEIIKTLADDAKTRLAHLGYRNIVIRYGNGAAGCNQEIQPEPPFSQEVKRGHQQSGGRDQKTQQGHCDQIQDQEKHQGQKPPQHALQSDIGIFLMRRRSAHEKQ